MPVYEYRCANCRVPYATRRSLGDTTPPDCPTCLIPTRRRYTPIAIRNSMPEHLNHSTGQYVTNERQFRDQLKVQSDIATARTGLDHNFIPHDPRDAKGELGVTDEGLEATYRRRREQGLPTGEVVTSASSKRREPEPVGQQAEVAVIEQEDEVVVWLD